MKTLVVFFSRKGYVKSVAESIAAERDADILEIKTTERTAGFLGFWWCGRFGMHRWGMPLEEYSVDVKKYDRVVLCSPVWVFSLSAPMRTFIAENAGKIKAADYVLVHFSGPMRYKKTVAHIDEVLGVKHDQFISVCCMWGKAIKKVSR